MLKILIFSNVFYILIAKTNNYKLQNANHMTRKQFEYVKSIQNDIFISIIYFRNKGNAFPTYCAYPVSILEFKNDCITIIGRSHFTNFKEKEMTFERKQIMKIKYHKGLNKIYKIYSK